MFRPIRTFLLLDPNLDHQRTLAMCEILKRGTIAGDSRRARLADSRVYVLLDGMESRDAFHDRVLALVAANVDVIQLRAKSLQGAELIERARLLSQLTRDSATLSIVNDRPEVAIQGGADGVHVGQEDASCAIARGLVGPHLLIGVSSHSLAQAWQAESDGADYVGVGPTFPSRTKSFQKFPGVPLLREVAAQVTIPAFAIGGIDVGNVELVKAAGFCRVAIGAAVAHAKDPGRVVRELRSRLIP